MSDYLKEPCEDQYPKVNLNIEFAPHKVMHIIVPAKKGNQVKYNPLILFVTQKARIKQENYHFPALLTLASHGFTIAILPANQLTGIAQEQVCQIKTALRHLLMHAYKFDIDTNRYFIWGEEQGAFLSSLCVLTANQQDWNAEDARVLPLRFKAGIAYGLPDPQELIFQIPSHKCAPLILFSGLQDAHTNVDETEEFIAQMEAKEHEAESTFLEETTNGTDAFYTPYMLTILEKKLRKYL